MAEDTLTMFGKTYNTVGSANTNLMLQTKGDLKIRWGNKFIDLVKNGKINAEADILKTADSSESISVDGIYLVKGEEKDEIWIKIGSALINLTQEVSQNFISYKEEQKLTNEERSMAITNIGLVFDTYASLTASGIKNGFAYVLETKKFFSIEEGTANEYSFDTKVPDPLEIGDITIKGSTGEIISTSKIVIDAGGSINFKIGGADVGKISNDRITLDKYISSDKGIQSHTYNDNTGFFVGINSENKAIGVFDEIVVRNGMETIKRVTYAQLRQLINDRKLTTNCEYEITDFQDVRNITFSTNAEDYSSNTEFRPKNVYPIIVKAKNSSKLYAEGYFSENPNWTIEYDPNYYYIVKYEQASAQEGQQPSATPEYRFAYSKGRITKMTDEFGNTANFDFKHTTFSNDKKFLFNIDNPRIKELDKLIELGSALTIEKAATNIYADATQDIDVTITVVTDPDNNTTAKFERIKNTQIVNNVVYLAEPELVNCPVVEGTKMTQFNDYIIFDCSTLTPNNNIINNVEGQYTILEQFEGNTIESLSGCNISGNITNCSFKGLSDGITITGPLDSVIIESDMTPNAANYVESNGSYVQNSPFVISVVNVPRLGVLGKKTCDIASKTYNGSDISVFVVRTVGDESTPSGVIVMFNGLASQIPDGWAICDGTNGTPDLRGRFIRMTDIGETPGARDNSDLTTNGTGTRQAYLDGTHVPKHTHTFKTYSDTLNVDVSGLTTDTIASTGTSVGKSAETGNDINQKSAAVGGSATVSISMTPEQDTENFPDKVNIEPQAYALIFIMKL